MAPHILRYTSSAKAYHLMPPVSLYSGKVDLWTVYETIQEHPRDDLSKKGIYEYRVVMEKEVATEQDLSGAWREALTIASDLEKVWIYAAARPFNFLRLTIQFPEGPTGWSGNFREVKQAIRQESAAELFLEILPTHQNWETPPFLPLETALNARAAYLAADPILQQLIDLHVAAFMHFGLPRFVILAHALEIAGAHYPDSTGGYAKVARNAGLQALMAGAGLDGNLTQTIEWLFDIANTRRDIRHAWNQKTGDLHPQLTTQEGKDFVLNADLVIRVFVCNQLSLPVVRYDGRL
jgi:hypothetical protein